MHLKKRFLCIARCLPGVMAIDSLSTPRLFGAVKASLVEAVLSGQPVLNGEFEVRVTGFVN
jgi:hypothetical protein